ncbi:hypothetical protein ACFQH8_17000 [Halomicroarcula sp. GCM10025710]
MLVEDGLGVDRQFVARSTLADGRFGFRLLEQASVGERLQCRDDLLALDATERVPVDVVEVVLGSLCDVEGMGRRRIRRCQFDHGQQDELIERLHRVNCLVHRCRFVGRSKKLLK